MDSGFAFSLYVEGGCGGVVWRCREVVLEELLLEEVGERGKMNETEMKSISRS